jgi:hypothetical protein
MALAADAHTRRAGGDGQDNQIDFRTEAAVEAEFFLEIAVAAAQGGEVQKPQVHRLFDLVGEVVGDKHPGDVRLDEGHFPGGLRIGTRVQQCRGQIHRLL